MNYPPLTPAQVKTYHQEGCLVIKNFFSTGEIDNCIAWRSPMMPCVKMHGPQ